MIIQLDSWANLAIRNDKEKRVLLRPRGKLDVMNPLSCVLQNTKVKVGRVL